MTNLFVKATLGEETRMVKIESPPTFISLCDKVSRVFDISAQQATYLRFSYVDQDGTSIKFSSDDEFQDAIDGITLDQGRRTISIQLRMGKDSKHEPREDKDVSLDSTSIAVDADCQELLEDEFVHVGDSARKAQNSSSESEPIIREGGSDVSAALQRNPPPSAPILQSLRAGRKLDLADLANKVRTCLDSARNVTQAQNGVVVFFGSTGAGKSTTINFLCGAKLEQLPNNSKFDTEIKLDVCEADKADYLRIGHEMQSATKTICVKKAKTGLYCCDMPGSNDTDPVDDIVNCVMRAKALREARSVRPVFVLSVKDFFGTRGQNMVDAVEYVAECFQSSKDFSSLTILVTHASDSEDLMTLGKVQLKMEQLQSLAACGPLGLELLGYMANELLQAVDALENQREITASVRVVRPLKPETRDDLLRVIERSRAIQDPKKGFRATLSDDAKKSLKTLAGEQHRHVMACFESQQYTSVADVLLNMSDIGYAIEPDLCEISQKWIVAENQNLFQQILGQISNSMNTALELLNVNRDIEKPLSRFKGMQIIYQNCAPLLKGWFTEEILRHDYKGRALAYVMEQMRTKDWSSMDKCSRKIYSIDRVMHCCDASVAATEGIRTLLHTIAQTILVGDLQEPSVIANALNEIHLAATALTDERASEAMNLMQSSVKYLTEQLEALLANCIELGAKVSQVSPAVQADNVELQRIVGKLYKLTRDSQLDSFLPKEFQINGSAAYFKRFREALPLDLPENRDELLQHSNLLACLSNAEDEELGSLLKRRKESLREVIASVMDQDFQDLQREYTKLFVTGRETPSDSEVVSSNLEMFIEARRRSIDSFFCAVNKVVELRVVDEMTGKMTCASRISEFFRMTYTPFLERCAQRIKSTLTFQPFDVLNMVVLLELCVSGSVAEALGKIESLAEDVQFICEVHNRCKTTVHSTLTDVCGKFSSRIENLQFRNKSSWKWADEASLVLSWLRYVPVEDNICVQSGEKLRLCCESFVEQQIDAFEKASKRSLQSVDCETDVLTIDAGQMIDAIEVLMPAMKGNFRNLPIDSGVLETLKDILIRTESQLAALANTARELSGPERSTLLENVKRLLDARRLYSVGEQSINLENAKQQLTEFFSAQKRRTEEELQDNNTDFDQVEQLLMGCSPDDRKYILDSTGSSAKRRIRDLKAFAEDLYGLDAQEQRMLVESLRNLVNLKESRFFSLLDEILREEIAQSLQFVEVKFSDCHQIISRCMANQSYSSDFECALSALKQVRKIFPTYFKDAKWTFRKHLDSVLQDPNVQNAVTILKKLHKCTQFKDIFGADYDTFLEQLQDKVSSNVHDMQENVKVAIHREHAGEAEAILKKMDPMMSELASCGLCQGEVGAHKELKEMFARMSTERKQTIQDYLDQRDWVMAVKILSTVAESHRAQAKHVLRNHIVNLKRNADQAEQSGCQSDMKPIFEDVSNLLTVLKENSADIDTHRDLIDMLEKNLQSLELFCLNEFAKTYDGISLLLNDGVLADFAKLSQPLASLKRLMQIPPQSVRDQQTVLQHREKSISGLHQFCKNILEFMHNQLQLIEEDNQQMDLKALKAAYLKVNQYQDTLLKDMGSLIGQDKRVREVVSFNNFSQNFSEKLNRVCKEKEARVLRLSSEGFKAETLRDLFMTLNRVANAFEGEYVNILRSAISGVTAVLKQLSGTASQASNSGDYEKVNDILRQLISAKERFAHSELLELKQCADNQLMNAMAPLVQDVRARAEKISGPSFREAALDLQQLRAQAGKVPQLQAEVVQSMSNALTRLKHCEGEEFILEVGQFLMSDDWGKFIIAEQPVFKLVKGYMYQTRIPPLLPEIAVKGMKGPKLDQKRLTQCIKTFDDKFKPLLGQYVKSTDTFQARKSRLVKFLIQWKSRGNGDTMELVANVCTLFALIKSGEKYSQGDITCIIAPHTIQIASILRLLGVDTGGPTVMDHCESLLKSLSLAGPRIHNHVMQIPTGEGKSIVLGVVASVFALQGISVDCVCYSKYLSHRDFADFSDLFDALEISKMVRYLTFQELCESHIQGVREAALNLITQGPSTLDGTRAAATEDDRRILLIDEVDVFFKRQFYGGTLNAGTLLQSPNIEKLIRLIWSKRNSWGESNDIKATAEYEAVTTEFPSIEPIIAWSAVAMTKNVKAFGTPRYQVRGGKIGYVINHVFDSSVSYPNRTIFAYLHENETNPLNITGEVVSQHMGIEIRCGEFSYASIPNRYYSSTFGVTGTLTTLPEPDKKVLENEFKVTLTTVAPSVYGDTNLDFNFDEPQHVMVEESVPFWHRKIAAEVKVATDAKRAVLVCFKNDDEIESFMKTIHLSNVQVLTSKQEDTDLEAIQGIVTNATVPKKITLLTRKYGRGVDFVCNSKDVAAAGGVMMVQTFYSSTLSEEAQIQGRVARQGERGSYRLILSADQVEQKFGVKITGITRAELKHRLKEAREKKVDEKIRQRNLRKKVAEHKDADAWALVESLVGGKDTRQNALRHLARNALTTPKRTYIIMLDVSGSMSSMWGSLAAAFNAFLDALLGGRSQGDAQDTLVTVVLFDNISKTTLQRQPLPSVPRLVNHMPSTGGSGGTNFNAAFNQCNQEVSAENELGRLCNVVFMTDGEGGDPSRMVTEMLHKNGKRIARYDCIPFGREAASVQVLETVRGLFAAQSIPTRMMQSNNAAELADAFTTCASEDVLYMK